jgi:hypothetical protein
MNRKKKSRENSYDIDAGVDGGGVVVVGILEKKREINGIFF